MARKGSKPPADSDAVRVAQISTRATRINTIIAGLFSLAGVAGTLVVQKAVAAGRPAESNRTQAATAEPGRPTRPSVTYWWLRTSESQAGCVARSTEVVKQYGATVPNSDSSEFVFGELGDYSVTVLCLADPSLKIITVNGPDSSRTRTLADDIKKRLQ
jgi:hypothetical protein